MLISGFRGRQPADNVSRKPVSIGCHYFLPCPRLPSQLQSVTGLGHYQFIPLGEQRHMHVNNLPVVTRCVTAERPGLNLRALEV